MHFLVAPLTPKMIAQNAMQDDITTHTNRHPCYMAHITYMNIVSAIPQIKCCRDSQIMFYHAKMVNSLRSRGTKSIFSHSIWFLDKENRNGSQLC